LIKYFRRPALLQKKPPGGFLRFAARRSGHPAQRNGRDFGILAGNVKSRAKIFKAALPNGYIGVKP